MIQALDGEEIDEPADLGEAIAKQQPGDVVTVTIERNGQTSDITVTLGKKPT